MAHYAQPHSNAELPLQHKHLQTVFQPVYSLGEQQILGYEALIRGTHANELQTPAQLFAAASATGQLCLLDNQCRQLACERFQQLQLPGLLFLNVSPESLLDPAHQPGRTLKLLNGLGLCPSRVVIELTEHAPREGFALLEKALRHYRAMGFRIALDDLGAGFSSLRLWSELRPDYVKVDRHFIAGIHQDAVKHAFVNSMLKMAAASHAQVIVEGVEQSEELAALISMGVDLVQGHLLCPPQELPPLQSDQLFSRTLANCSNRLQSESPLLQLTVQQTAVSHNTIINLVIERFAQQPGLNSLAVLDARRKPLGIIHRQPLAEAMLRPFANDLLGRKPVSRLMSEDFLGVEQNQSLQQVSRLLTSRAGQRIDEEFVILRQGVYQGMGRVIDVLRMITSQQIQLARHSNPLTLLPGNIPTQQCLSNLLLTECAGVVCHVDIDHFKPFNALYGHAKGDEVLLCLAQCLRECIDLSCDFAGHPAEDDFMLVFRSSDWRSRLNTLQMDFQHESRRFYHSEHLQAGCFSVINRQGRWEEYPLLTLSLGVVSFGNSSGQQRDATDLQAMAGEALQQAKAIPGYSLHLIDAG